MPRTIPKERELLKKHTPMCDAVIELIMDFIGGIECDRCKARFEENELTLGVIFDEEKRYELNARDFWDISMKQTPVVGSKLVALCKGCTGQWRAGKITIYHPWPEDEIREDY